MRQEKSAGTLFVVATPIGNLEDITARALRVLKEADLVAAEDTRHAAHLLNHFGIGTTLISCHEHNETQRSRQIIERLLSGDSIALISDAGTPLISDPGHILVSAAIDAGVTVTPVPGPSALISALCVGGNSAARFQFIGFLPATVSQRERELRSLSGYEATLVFYESTHRIVDSLRSMAKVLGHDRRATLCRELTKKFETIIHAPLGELADRFRDGEAEKRGEFVVVVQGAGDTQNLDPGWIDAVVEMYEYMPMKKAAKIVAGLTGARSQALYTAAMEVAKARR